MRYEHRIIYDWPGQLRTSRKHPQFRVKWPQILDDLEVELGFLRAKDVVLETAHTDAELRMDGSLKGNAGQPAHPGVILSFDSRHGALRYYTDAYWGWQANVRAISLGLESLRAVDRYGITGLGQQYTGWAKLPPGQAAAAPQPRTMSPDKARSVIAEMLGLGAGALTIAPEETLGVMYRTAARKAHPDAGGNPEDWRALREAAEVLGIR